MKSIEKTVLEEKNLYSLSEAKRALAGNFLLMLIMIVIMKDAHLPKDYITLWVMAMTSISIYRVFYLKKWLPIVQTQNTDINHKQIYHHSNVYLMLIGLLWSFAYFPIILNAQNHLDYLILTIIIGFSGASIYSSGASFQTFLALNIFPVISVIWAFLHDFSQHYFTPIAITCLAIFFIGSAAWRFSQYFRENIVKNVSITQAKNELIQALGRAGEYRDEETGCHVNRMSHSCYLLAKELGYHEEKALVLKNAATLHDVGKIGIPDSILLKPGKLTQQEREIMQKHVNIGYDILNASQNSEVMQKAQVIALSHHERWDGKGYPQGLSGEEIPIEGRIASLCDVYDALTSERPYKKAWSSQDAIKHIMSEAGGAFDPNLVPHFCAILPEIQKFREQNPDEFNANDSMLVDAYTSVDNLIFKSMLPKHTVS